MRPSDSNETTSPRLSRRSFIAFVGGLGSAALLSACGSSGEDASSGGDGSSDSATSNFGSDGKLRVGMEAAYPPYNWQTSEASEFTIPIENVDGAYADGYDAQIAKTVGAALGLEPVAVKLEWDSLIDSLDQGKIDVIISGMSATSERLERISFSDPYYMGNYGLVVRKGSAYESATSLDDFKGAAVLGKKNTLLDTVIDEIDGVKHLTPVASVAEQVSSLLAGSCDAITFDAGNIASVTKAHPELAGVIFEDGKGFFMEVPVNVGLSKGQLDILDKINSALVEISEDDREKLWDTVVARQPQ